MTGSKFDVGDVLYGSLNLIVKRPVIALPAVMLIVITLIPIPFETAIIGMVDLISVLYIIILLIAYVLVIGAYPLIVRDAITGSTIDFRNSLVVSAGKFFTIIGVEIVITLLTMLGLIFFIIPGLIIMSLYFYCIPAIVLEDRGIKNGLSASETFAKDKKFKTFLLYMLPDLAYAALMGVTFAIQIIVLFRYAWLIEFIGVIGLVLFTVYTVWIFIIPSYVYIEYAMKYEETECTIDISE